MKYLIFIGFCILLLISGCNIKKDYYTKEGIVRGIDTSYYDNESELFQINGIKLEEGKVLEKKGILGDNIEEGEFVEIIELESIYLIKRIR